MHQRTPAQRGFGFAARTATTSDCVPHQTPAPGFKSQHLRLQARQVTGGDVGRIGHDDVKAFAAEGLHVAVQHGQAVRHSKPATQEGQSIYTVRSTDTLGTPAQRHLAAFSVVSATAAGSRSIATPSRDGFDFKRAMDTAPEPQPMSKKRRAVRFLAAYVRTRSTSSCTGKWIQ